MLRRPRERPSRSTRPAPRFSQPLAFQSARSGARLHRRSAPLSSGPIASSEQDMTGQNDGAIDFGDFLKVDIRVGTIVDAQPFPEARRPATKLWIDFGPGFGVRKTSAQITRRHPLDSLVGRQVAAVVNFPPRQVGPFMSEVLVLGFPDADGNVVLVTPGHPVPNGGRLY